MGDEHKPEQAEGAIPLEPESPAPGEPRIDGGSLLDDFDEDADFERDPEVDRALGLPVADATRPESHSTPRPKPKQVPEHDLFAAHPDRWVVRSTMPGLQLCLIIAAGLLLATLLMIGVQGGPHPWLRGAMAVYSTIFHTATGVLAALILCVLVERGFNHPELVAARMLVASAVFHLGLTLQVPIPGRVDEYLLAAGLYGLMVWSLFRLPRQETGLLCAAHLSLWVLVQIGYSLELALAAD